MEKIGNQLYIISYERTIASQNHQFEYSYILFDGDQALGTRWEGIVSSEIHSLRRTTCSS